MGNTTNIELTSSEISSLWGTCMSDNMAACVIKFFLNNVFKDEPRSLLTIEISNIFINMLRNVIGMPLLMGFVQVAQSEQVQQYMLRGREIASKHIQIFRSIFEDEHIPVPSTSHSFVTDSEEFTFSDKLMMFIISVLITSSLSTYTTAIATSLRHDLHTVYLRLSAEIAKYASDGINIMIENKWMEQPPQTIRHENLLKV